MRIIKFRAWHEGALRMFSAEEMTSDQLTLLPIGQFINVSSVSTRLSQVYDNMIPLQFTGLHDKNGKEIYEGDVVRIGSRSPVKVRWHDESAGFLDIGMELMSNTEVIGNIYENPEILST